MENTIGDNAPMIRLKILWIDDNPSRDSNLAGLEGHPYKNGHIGEKVKVKTKFLNVYKKDALDSVGELHKKWDYDLVIIDHFLNNAKGHGRKGPTIASFVRDEHPNCPVVGVTAANLVKEVDPQTISNYEDLFIVQNIGDYFDLIYSIALAFKILKKEKKWNAKKICDLLGAPAEETITLSEILPENKTSNVLFLRELYKWTRNDLIGKPGFLFDRKWISTLIGLKENSFLKVEKSFKGAEYTGIFSTESDKRWWKTTVKEIIFKISKTKKASLPWNAGRSLPGIKKTDYSACALCGEEFPETMGFSDESLKKVVPLHYSCSSPFPGKSQQLYFEQVRLIKDKR